MINNDPASIIDIRAVAVESTLERLAEILLLGGKCDARVLDRGRRVAEETGQRLDVVLLQLGLVSERAMAEAYAALLELKVTPAEGYPTGSPLFAERLVVRFLRSAAAMPIALEGETLVVAMADPLDTFTPAAIAAATGMPVRLEVAVPMELDLAFKRLYPEGDDHPVEDARCQRAVWRTTPSG